MPAIKHIFVDANVSPEIASWIAREFNVKCTHVSALDLEYAEDAVIFRIAQEEGCAILSKDRDFVPLVKRRLPPPALIWLRCRNLPDPLLKALFRQQLPRVLSLLRMGESVVEISDQHYKGNRPKR